MSERERRYIAQLRREGAVPPGHHIHVETLADDWVCASTYDPVRHRALHLDRKR